MMMASAIASQLVSSSAECIMESTASLQPPHNVNVIQQPLSIYNTYSWQPNNYLINEVTPQYLSQASVPFVCVGESGNANRNNAVSAPQLTNGHQSSFELMCLPTESSQFQCYSPPTLILTTSATTQPMQEILDSPSLVFGNNSFETCLPATINPFSSCEYVPPTQLHPQGLYVTGIPFTPSVTSFLRPPLDNCRQLIMVNSSNIPSAISENVTITELKDSDQDDDDGGSPLSCCADTSPTIPPNLCFTNEALPWFDPCASSTIGLIQNSYPELEIIKNLSSNDQSIVVPISFESKNTDSDSIHLALQAIASEELMPVPQVYLSSYTNTNGTSADDNVIATAADDRTTRVCTNDDVASIKLPKCEHKEQQKQKESVGVQVDFDDLCLDCSYEDEERTDNKEVNKVQPEEDETRDDETSSWGLEEYCIERQQATDNVSMVESAGNVVPSKSCSSPKELEFRQSELVSETTVSTILDYDNNSKELDKCHIDEADLQTCEFLCTAGEQAESGKDKVPENILSSKTADVSLQSCDDHSTTSVEECQTEDLATENAVFPVDENQTSKFPHTSFQQHQSEALMLRTADDIVTHSSNFRCLPVEQNENVSAEISMHLSSANVFDHSCEFRCLSMEETPNGKDLIAENTKFTATDDIPFNSEYEDEESQFDDESSRYQVTNDTIMNAEAGDDVAILVQSSVGDDMRPVVIEAADIGEYLHQTSLLQKSAGKNERYHLTNTTGSTIPTKKLECASQNELLLIEDRRNFYEYLQDLYLQKRHSHDSCIKWGSSFSNLSSLLIKEQKYFSSIYGQLSLNHVCLPSSPLMVNTAAVENNSSVLCVRKSRRLTTTIMKNCVVLLKKIHPSDWHMASVNSKHYGESKGGACHQRKATTINRTVFRNCAVLLSKLHMSCIHSQSVDLNSIDERDLFISGINTISFRNRKRKSEENCEDTELVNCNRNKILRKE